MQRTASERDQPAETPSTPVESLVKKLTNERIIELKKVIYEEQQEFAKLKEDMLFLHSASMDEGRLREMWNQIEQEKIQKESAKVRHDQWLKERDEKKLEFERQWRPGFKTTLKTQKSVQEDTSTDTIQQQAGTATSSPSPLLTSLLKSSQANQSPPIPPSNTARLAPTITNLLTASNSSSSNSPSHITQSSTNAQNNLINAPVSVAIVPNVIINHSACSVQIPVSQSAPTLVTLLDKKTAIALDPSTSEKKQLMLSISVPESIGGKDGADGKDEEADILAEFNELIADKFDDEDLEDINAIIMNPEILDDKLPEDEPIKDIDDSSQATSTDDYDKLKIKQLVEDFAGVPDVEVPTGVQEIEQAVLTAVDDSEVIQVPSEPEISNPTSIEMIEPNESNDSKADSPAQDDKVMIISDESSTNDDKKEKLIEKIDIGEGEESQSIKSSVADDTKEDDSNKESRPFKEFQERNDALAGSEKESKELNSTVYQVDDSDEDVLFEDAKESHDDSGKKDKKTETTNKKLPDKTADVVEAKPSTSKASLTETVDKSRSAGSVDSDDEVLEVKVSRSTGRKKANESFKADTPGSSTRTRDHSENDDKIDSTPIRTRSRHSSLIPASEPKSTYNFSKEQDHSMWKARWEDCLKDLQKHKDYSAVIDNKIIPDDSYKTVILCPMNLKTIQKNIENNLSTLPGDVKRDFALMCTNIIMLNKKGSKHNDMVNQFIKDGIEIIENNLEVEDVFKSYRKQIKKKN